MLHNRMLLTMSCWNNGHKNSTWNHGVLYNFDRLFTLRRVIRKLSKIIDKFARWLCPAVGSQMPHRIIFYSTKKIKTYMYDTIFKTHPLHWYRNWKVLRAKKNLEGPQLTHLDSWRFFFISSWGTHLTDYVFHIIQL